MLREHQGELKNPYLLMGRGALGFFRLRQALGVSARRASAVAPSASAPSLCLFASWPLRFLRQARRSTARRSLRLRGNAGSWRPWGVRTFTVRAFSAPSDRTQGSCDRLQESSHLARARARSGTQEENGTQERTQERNETRPVFEVERSPLPRRIARLHEKKKEKKKNASITDSFGGHKELNTTSF